MSLSSKVKEAVEWYSKNRSMYGALADKVESIIREILGSEKINYHSITSRTKSVERFKEKASKEWYKNPQSEIMDMAGIRVITYTDCDAKRVFEVVKGLFEFYPEHSMDKAEELGIDRVGYRSIHCVGTLGKGRLKLPENRIFKGLCFEIQIRTILQHAWAEFEHDRNYKFSGVLPKNLRRRLSVLAGSLELLDREFDGISKAIDTYTTDIGEKTELGELSIPINTTSLVAYMNSKFQDLVELGMTPDLGGADAEIMDELSDMGIDTLEKLEKIIPTNYVEVKGKHIAPEMDSFAGTIRDLLMIHDADTYFKIAWKRHWKWTFQFGIDFLKESYDIDMSEYIKKYNLRVTNL